MKNFLTIFSSKIKGNISGFDRLVIKGLFRNLNYTEGMFGFLLSQKVLLKDFGGYVESKSQEFKNKSYAYIEKLDRPIIYLNSSGIRKKEYAQKISMENNIKDGLICVLKTVDPFYGYAIYKNRDSKKLELKKRERKCLHLYYYWNDSEFGFMGARIQTWFPYTCYIYMNGREWLEKMLLKKKLSYKKIENCFVDISDFNKAQQLLKKQLEIDWPKKMDRIARIINPLYNEFKRRNNLEYYWTIDQSEWATDIVFKSKEELKKIYDIAVRESITLYSAKDIMRFTGKKLHGNFKGEITSHYKDRPEGVRIKHSIKNNSIKMYDKQGIILRVETTINNPYCFKMYREKEGLSDKPGIYPIRKSVADVYRRSNVSEKCNQRFIDSVASLKTTESFYKLISPICSSTEYNNRRARAIRPWEEYDKKIIQTIANNNFIINGFRNKQIREIIFPNLKDEKELKKASSKITRYLWILRAHGIIKKIPGTYRYQLTDQGRKIIPAILKTLNLSMDQLSMIA